MGKRRGIAADRLYTDAEAAELLGVSTFELRWLMSPQGAKANGTKPLVGINVGPRVMFYGRALTGWLSYTQSVREQSVG